MKLEDYIEQMKNDSTSSHIELDKEREIRYMQERSYDFKRIIKSIPVLPGTIRILDIGTTPFTLFIKKKFPEYDVWALDRTNLMEDRCKRAGIQLKVCDLDNVSIPFEDEYFDIVIFTEVLEHVFAPPTSILTEIKRIMRPSGKLILSVPNIATLSKRIRLLFGITPLPNPDKQMKKEWVHGHGHIHEYTRKEILSLCKSANFGISNVQMTSITPLELLREKKFDLIRLLYCCITFLVPSFRAVIYIECHK
jgi:SAM-dependent methyltransferase